MGKLSLVVFQCFLILSGSKRLNIKYKARRSHLTTSSGNVRMSLPHNPKYECAKHVSGSRDGFWQWTFPKCYCSEKDTQVWCYGDRGWKVAVPNGYDWWNYEQAVQLNSDCLGTPPGSGSKKPPKCEAINGPQATKTTAENEKRIAEKDRFMQLPNKVDNFGRPRGPLGRVDAYLISKEWLESWVMYVNGQAPRPGQITNQDLINRAVNAKSEDREDCPTWDFEFFHLSKDQWGFLNKDQQYGSDKEIFIGEVDHAIEPNRKRLICVGGGHCSGHEGKNFHIFFVDEVAEKRAEIMRNEKLAGEQAAEQQAREEMRRETLESRTPTWTEFSRQVKRDDHGLVSGVQRAKFIGETFEENNLRLVKGISILIINSLDRKGTSDGQNVWNMEFKKRGEKTKKVKLRDRQMLYLG